MFGRHSTNNMLVWLLWLPVLFSDTALSKDANDLPFRTLGEMAVGGFETTKKTTFEIPHNQCSGFIDESLLCGKDGVAGVVRVVVSERMSFPSVRIDRQLRNVTITRQQNGRGHCPGVAHVDLRVGCLVDAERPVLVPRTRHAREARQYLPPVGDTGLLTDD